MNKIDIGFPCERCIAIPQPFLDLMHDNPLTGDLYIHSLGHIANAVFHRVSHSQASKQHIFLYCTAGKGNIILGNKKLVLTANQCIILPAGVPHEYASDQSDPWTLYWIAFMGAKGVIFANAMGEPNDVPPSIYSRIEQRLELFETMYACLCGELNIERLNYANIVLAHFLIVFLQVDLVHYSIERKQHVDSLVNRVTQYMSDNIERNLTLKEIASFVGYSESYFYRRFIKETGRAPIDYFIHMKINKASVYLIKTSMSVAQIAAKLGFSNPDYFSRTFKRIIGLSATEFRKQDFRL